MSLITRIRNLFKGDRLNRDLDEELNAHVEEAISNGDDPATARAALGNALQHREASRDIRTLAWAESLRADAVFAARQIAKSPVTSAAAVLSLGLAVGASISAFRLIDALLLRPLPILSAERLHIAGVLIPGRDGQVTFGDGMQYPLFRELREAARGEAELLAISFAERVDVNWSGSTEIEKARRQYVSGSMFTTFGLQPAIGRVLTERDDRTPGAHPYAVLSHDYWTRRFGQDRNIPGRTFRAGNQVYEVIGVVAAPFTGTEPGVSVDIFVPAVMHPSVDRIGAHWLRAMLHLHPGVALKSVEDRFQGPFQAFQQRRVKGFTGMPSADKQIFLKRRAALRPASSGYSNIQQSNRSGLVALAVLVALVLLIACVNVANLMSARAASRAREMALRVSIGAGRARLIQLVMMESLCLAVLATAAGAVFAWWSAPFIVSMINPPDDPARIYLPPDWRVLGFGAGVTLAATVLFGLAPALRASSVRPASALKGGEDPHQRRRFMRALVGVQVAFCFVVHFAGGLFVGTYQKLTDQPLGFDADRLLVLDTVAATPQLPQAWAQVADHLRSVPGVQSVAFSGQALMSGRTWNEYISVRKGAPEQVLPYILTMSPGWLETMKIPLMAGRDLREGDATPGAAIVNEAFVRQYFSGENPLGKTFEITFGQAPFEIVGVAANARYAGPREPIVPVVYLPFRSVDAKAQTQPVRDATILVRTSQADSPQLAAVLRSEVSRARSEFRVSNLRTQRELIDAYTVRERLLAAIALFFSGLALLLAGVGLFGVLDYSVLQQRREIGIRMALGARASLVLRGIASETLAMVMVGAFAGVAIGLACERYVRSMLFGVEATDVAMLALPAAVILAVAIVAALPPAIRAIRIDPAATLRSQ